MKESLKWFVLNKPKKVQKALFKIMYQALTQMNEDSIKKAFGRTPESEALLELERQQN